MSAYPGVPQDISKPEVKNKMEPSTFHSTSRSQPDCPAFCTVGASKSVVSPYVEAVLVALQTGMPKSKLSGTLGSQ